MAQQAMRNKPMRNYAALARVFGPVEIILSMFVFVGVVGLLLLSIEDSRNNDLVVAGLNSSDSPLEVASATSRDTLTLSQKTRDWVGGFVSRRDVQIARAGLATRLNVTDSYGAAAGETFKPELQQPLAEFDQAVLGAPTGVLLAADQDTWAKTMNQPLRNLEDAAKAVIRQRQYLSDQNAIEIVSQDTRLAWFQFFLALCVVLTAGLLFFLVWTGTRRNFRRTTQILSDEQEELRQSLDEIGQMKELMHDESRLLQLIISASSLESVFTEISAVGSKHSEGRPFRVSIDSIESQSEGYDGTEVIKMSWPFEIERWEKTGVVASLALPHEVNGENSLSGAGSVEFQLDVGRRCAELAKIAVSDSWARRELKYEATHDPLTGLCNRAFLEQRLSEVLKERNAGGLPVALVFCDIDRFKLVNDSLGHKAGDVLLVNLASSLSSLVDVFLRSPAGLSADILLSRFGGDEFVLLCTADKAIEAALALGLRISELSRRPIELEGIETFSDMSIGIAVSTDAANTVEKLVRNADVAMYRSKALGLGGPVLYSGEDEADRLEHLQTNTMLRRAFERDEFRLHLQPIIEFSTKQTVGFEGLVRWKHPTLGLLTPNYFLENLDELGLIGQLDAWMRREGFAAMADLNTSLGSDTPYLSLNVTVRELQNATFKQEVLDQIRTAGISAEQVVLELSENAFVDLEGNEQLLVDLRASGVRIALDDFGTGYSSLMQLQQLPIDIVKLDRAFVSALTSGGKRALGVLEGLLQVISAVELTLVVEGVETKSEQDVLVSLGCKFAQGYLYGLPAPAIEVLAQYIAELPSAHGEYPAR